ncbi:MAG: NADH-quinone oxidoreductase subunit H [Methylothermaceae bacterium]|nr:NADH-quinone oxidoreductase subunit H [Methylothermaceae bacterium]
MAWLLNLVQVLLFVAAAPLLSGWIKKLKCWSQNRRAPSLLQPYRDLAKLLRKETVAAEGASWVFYLAPYLIFAVAVLAATIVPLMAVHLPTSAMADVIVLVGFFALARFFQALAGLDIGTAFGGMGASREMTIASLAEPAMLMAVFTLAVSMSTTNLSAAIESLLHQPLMVRPSFLFAGLGLALVTVAETGRIPVDNPATHLELTMIHEAMILEYSGRHLALIEWAAQIRLMIYAVLLANIFIPQGLAETFALPELGRGALIITLKLAALAVILVLAEAALAKMRLFRAPLFLGFAYLLALLGMLTHVILEVG